MFFGVKDWIFSTSVSPPHNDLCLSWGDGVAVFWSWCWNICHVAAKNNRTLWRSETACSRYVLHLSAQLAPIFFEPCCVSFYATSALPKHTMVLFDPVSQLFQKSMANNDAFCSGRIFGPGCWAQPYSAFTRSFCAQCHNAGNGYFPVKRHLI